MLITVADRYGDLDIEDLERDEPQTLAPNNENPLNFRTPSEHHFDYNQSFEEAFDVMLSQAMEEEELPQGDEEIDADADYETWLRSHDPEDL